MNSSEKVKKETIKSIMSEIGITKLKKPMFDIIDKSVNDSLKNILILANSLNKHSQRKTLTARDINEALKISGQHKLYGYICQPNIEYERIPDTNLIIPVDKTISIDKLLHTNPPPAEKEEYFSFHWQCIHGNTPKIDEVVIDDNDKDEQELMVKDISWNIEGEKKIGNRRKSVSPEQQVFFIETAEKFMKGVDEPVYEKLLNYGSLPIFLPFFLKFITDFISVNIYNSEQMLRSLMFTKSLFCNKSIDKGKYCGDFVSIATTLCVTPTIYEGESKFNVRDEAAAFLSEMLLCYESQYPFLKESVIKELIGYYKEKNISQKYGAASAIFAISPSLFEDIMLPNLRSVLDDLKNRLNSSNDEMRMDIMSLISLYVSLAQRCFVTFERGKRVDKKKMEYYNDVITFNML